VTETYTRAVTTDGGRTHPKDLRWVMILLAVVATTVFHNVFSDSDSGRNSGRPSGTTPAGRYGTEPNPN
jgi:hypothetical protein